MNLNTKKIALLGLFIALSVIGANVKIYSSIALDSFPALLAGLILGPVYGGIVGLIGHMITSVTSGFPLGLITHLIIAVFMFATVYFYTIVYLGIVKKSGKKKLGLIIASIVGIIINAPLTLIALSPILTPAVALVLLAPLTLGATVNFLLGNIVYIALEGRLNEI